MHTSEFSSLLPSLPWQVRSPQQCPLPIHRWYVVLVTGVSAPVLLVFIAPMVVAIFNVFTFFRDSSLNNCFIFSFLAVKNSIINELLQNTDIKVLPLAPVPSLAHQLFSTISSLCWFDQAASIDAIRRFFPNLRALTRSLPCASVLALPSAAPPLPKRLI